MKPSVWKNNVNASIRRKAMFLSPHAYKSLSSIQIITIRVQVATLNGNPQKTIICCYSPTNIIEEAETGTFYNELSSITRQIPKHSL